MKNLLKNKLALIIIVVVIILLIVGGVLFSKFHGSAKGLPTSGDQSQNVETLSPDAIGLVLTPRADGKAINMKVTKLTGIKSIEYDVSYDANVTEEGQTANVPRGVVGSAIEVKSGDTVVQRDLDLGTCSRNVCKYDDVVGPIKFVLKITFTDGRVASVSKSITL